MLNASYGIGENAGVRRRGGRADELIPPGMLAGTFMCCCVVPRPVAMVNRPAHWARDNIECCSMTNNDRITMSTDHGPASMSTDHGSRINNKGIPKTLISDHCSLINERPQPRTQDACVTNYGSAASPPVTCNPSPVTSPRQRRAAYRRQDACTTNNARAARPSSNS